MTILYFILWAIGLVVVPLIVAEIGVRLQRGPGGEKIAGAILAAILGSILYVIVSALAFFT